MAVRPIKWRPNFLGGRPQVSGVNVALVNEIEPARVTLAAKWSSAHQEGGSTVMLGTFTPTATTVEIDVDLSGYSPSWGGTGFVFNYGVLPGVPPTPVEGGAKVSLITDVGTNHASTPLAGVTEYAQWDLGQMEPGGLLGKVRRRIVLTGLTVGRVYQWEVRAGGYSYFKEHIFPTGWAPTFLATIPAPESYLVVGMAGATRIVSMVSHGWAPSWKHEEAQLEMQRHYDIAVPADILDLAGQTGPVASARYVLVLHSTTISILDTWTPNLAVSNMALPCGHNTMRVIADRAGAYFYVGCNNGHVQRFNIATLAFNQQTAIPISDYVIPFGTNTGDTFLWIGSFINKTVYKMTLATQAFSGPYANYGGIYYDTGAVLGDGRIIAVDDTNGNAFLLSAADASYIDAVAIAGGGTGGNPYISIAPGDERFMWTRGNRMGWAWVDTMTAINNGAFGLTGPFGAIRNTENEATCVAIPTNERVVQWPGGTAVIDPSQADPTSFGAQFADLVFRGATANGG